MRLGYYYHVPAMTRKEGIYMPGYQALFIDELAKHFKEVVCFLYAPSEEEIQLMDTPIKAQNVRVESLGPHPRAFHQILCAGKIVRRVSPHFAQIDILLLRGPSPLLPEFSRQAKKNAQALLLVGDYVEGLSGLPGHWFRRAVIRCWAKINRQEQAKAACGALTFVNNRHLLNAFQGKAARLSEIRTTTIQKRDFYFREDTCLQEPVKLLYSGRMDTGKGLEDSLDALAILVGNGFNAVMDFVGPQTSSDHVWERMTAKAAEKGLHGRIHYHGNRPVGPELWEFYRKADIYVLASREAEGFPRTLWEAMAQSLPVIATRVGSIADYAGSAVMFVDPKRPDQLASAIQTLAASPELRRKMITEGRLIASECLLEKQTEKMVGMMEAWADECHGKN